MYLYERIIGNTIYCLFLIIFTLYISKKKNKNLKLIFSLYTAILAIMGLLFKPAVGNDLYRINIALEAYSKYNIPDVIKSLSNSMTPVATLIYYGIAKTGYYSLLPALVTIIVFNNIFYIIKDYSSKNNVDPRATALTLFFVMSTGFFIEVISGIRTMLAFSILARCFYNELYNNRSIGTNILKYICTVLIHSSAIAIIILRLIYGLFYSTNIKLMYKISLLVILPIIYMILNKYILNSLSMFSKYLSADGYFWVWEFIKILYLIFISFVIIYINKQLNINKYYKFNGLIILFTIILINEFNIFLRFNYFNVFMMIPLVINATNNAYKKQLYNKNKWLIISSLIMLVLSCTRGNLSSLKFFEL